MALFVPQRANTELAKVACDQCHRCKLRCSRDLPRCSRCYEAGSPCTFSTGKPIGKPRGSKNKAPRRRQGLNMDNIPQPEQNSRKRKRNHTEFGENEVNIEDEAFCVENPTGQINSSSEIRVGLQDNQRHLQSSFVKSHRVPLSWPSRSSLEPTMPEFLDTQPISRSKDLSTAFTSSNCACSSGGLEICLVLFQIHQNSASIPFDRYLSILRSAILFSEQSFQCDVCRHNHSMELCLFLIHKAMCYYKVLLNGKKISSSEIKIATGSQLRCKEKDVEIVSVGGLDVDKGLQMRIVEAVVKKEMKSGTKLLMAFEQIKRKEVDDGIDINVGTALARLAKALREELEATDAVSLYQK